jgi:uncharacterized protein YjbI with pentapeptide repeats/uncharacterized RDD family membrane protein YckC
MANPSIKTEPRSTRQSKNPSIPVRPRSSFVFLSRRLAAWVVEVSFLGVSAAVPYVAGVYLNQTAPETVPLHPALVNLQNKISTSLNLPRSIANSPPVAPATNILWWLSIATPLLVGGSQIYLLATTGQTLPKRWLGIKVVASGGQPPQWLRTTLREGVGRWGLPCGTAYLIWRYSIGFPSLEALLVMGGVLVAAETAALFFNSRWRSFHDSISGTVVIDAHKTKTKANTERVSRDQSIPSLAVEVQSYNGDSFNSYDGDRAKSIILRDSTTPTKFNLWLWMRQHPAITLLIIAGASIGSVLAAFIGTQIYVQNQADRRESKAQNNQVFISLIEQLSGTATDPTQERKVLILALARVDDPRAIPYLVDLLGQERDPEVIASIEQALASSGTKALSALRRLNQSLDRDLQGFAADDNSEEKRLLSMRLGTTKESIAKILTIYSSQLNKVSLHHTDLGRNESEFGRFALTLDRVDLSGLNLRSSDLSQASLRGTFFSGAGGDKQLGTADDAIADLSGAELKAADLSNSTLARVSLQGANLMQADLTDSNLENAQMQDTNLSSSKLVGANLRGATLVDSSLTGADLRDVRAQNIDLTKANLGRVKATGGDFQNANLSQSNWQAADLDNANFSNANLQQVDLSSTQLEDANLTKAQLQNSNLSNANLNNADLRGANLSGADFQGTILTEPSLGNGDDAFIQTAEETDGAKVKGVDFSQVRNLDDRQIEYICSEGGTHPRCQ